MVPAVRSRILLAALVATGAAPPAAWASCAGPDPSLTERQVLVAALAVAPVAFVGTVERGGRVARVRVEEVWLGPELPEIVQVAGGPGDGGVSSVDRPFEQGRRYLFVPNGRPPSFEDNACTQTRLWEPALDDLRPGGVRAAGPVTPAPFWSRGWFLAASTVLLLGGGIAALVWAQRRWR